jgi:ankyrin repeat protein
MAHDDLIDSSQRVRDEHVEERQTAPPPVSTPEESSSTPRKLRRQRPKPTPNPDADHVLQLCREGRLFELQQWIAAGRSIVMPSDYKKSPLGIAVQTGFHSLIELLLQHESDQAAKNAVLVEACQERQVGLVELALQYGADPRAVSFLDALLAWDRRVVSVLLERGADVVTDYPFARAFQMRIRTALGCYLDCRRQRPDLAEVLQQQADMALRQACSDKNLKWVSLLLWVGADPRAKGLAVDDVSDPDIANDSEAQRSALQEACICGRVEIVKRLKPDPSSDDLSGLLRDASTFAKRDVIAYLLSLGASPNDKPNGGSSALDGCLRALQWEDSYHFHSDKVLPASNLTKSRAVIGLLLERGARWRPDARTIADVRKALYHIDPEVITEITDRLRDWHACDDGILHELLRTPKMQELLQASRRSKVVAERNAVASVPEPQRLPTSIARYLAHYDRRHLYKQVWSAPMPKIGKHYGVTEIEIAKACRHLHIPTPPEGYWTEKEAGLPVSAPPMLPPLPASMPKHQTDERSS